MEILYYNPVTVMKDLTFHLVMQEGNYILIRGDRMKNKRLALWYLRRLSS